MATARSVAGGGTAATAAVALVSLGVPAAFVGAIGDDEAGAWIRDGLAAEGVDLSELVVVPGARSVESTILVGDGTRAIVTTEPPAFELSERAVELCRRAQWVHLDHEGFRRVRPRLHELGAPVSLDAGNPIDDLSLDRIALYAPSEAVFDGRRAELTVVTRGARGCVAYCGNDTIEVAGHPVDAVSTLGAGDVFHGALLAGLVRGRPLREALEAANVAAALSCRALDGRSAIPTEGELP